MDDIFTIFRCFSRDFVVVEKERDSVVLVLAERQAVVIAVFATLLHYKDELLHLGLDLVAVSNVLEFDFNLLCVFVSLSPELNEKESEFAIGFVFLVVVVSFDHHADFALISFLIFTRHCQVTEAFEDDAFFQGAEVLGLFVICGHYFFNLWDVLLRILLL
jgi:hypothetical protein